jgi:transposase
LLVNERGTSSTCPDCSRRVPKPAGRNFRCPYCGHQGHRDLVAAANVAGAPTAALPCPRRPGLSFSRFGYPRTLPADQ